nr:MAG TPA: hypothetical protein [Caudoviricetes sp.]
MIPSMITVVPAGRSSSLSQSDIVFTSLFFLYTYVSDCYSLI